MCAHMGDEISKTKENNTLGSTGYETHD